MSAATQASNPYEDADVDAELADAIGAYLMEQTSADAPMTAKEIAAYFDLDESHETCPETRRHINAARRRYPIASGNQGYYALSTRDELAEWVEQRRQRIHREREGLKKVVAAFNREVLDG